MRIVCKFPRDGSHRVFIGHVFRKDSASDAAAAAKKTAESAKATANEKLDQAKKAGENLKDKADAKLQDA